MTIKWLNEELYDKILPLLGGSHTLLVKLKILHKNYGLSAMKDWWVDSSVVALQIKQPLQGKHYCCLTWIHKQSFDTRIGFRIMKILENLTLDDTFTY